MLIGKVSVAMATDNWNKTILMTQCPAQLHDNSTCQVRRCRDVSLLTYVCFKF